jgi:hypothetical protein
MVKRYFILQQEKESNIDAQMARKTRLYLTIDKQINGNGHFLYLTPLSGIRVGGARWSSGQCAQRAIAEAKHRS